MRVRVRVVVTALLAAGLLAGCANVVDGTGSSGSGAPGGSGSNAPDFPSQPAAPSGSGPAGGSSATIPSTVPSAPTPSGSNPPGTNFACPDIAYPYAHLAFDCLTPSLTPEADNKIWPLALSRLVEPASGWVMEEGAGHWGAPGSETLSEIATEVRGRMVDGGGYGTSPKVTTTSSKDTTVAGVKAHELETTFTIDPTWAAANKTKVKQERSWIIALQVGSDDVSLWYASIPDLAQQYWAAVPNAIASIKVAS